MARGDPQQGNVQKHGELWHDRLDGDGNTPRGSENEPDTAQVVAGEANVDGSQKHSEMIANTVHEGLLILDRDLHVDAANDSFYHLFETEPEETLGHLVYELVDGQWNRPELRQLLEERLPKDKVVTDLEVTHDFEDIRLQKININARYLDDHQRIVLAIEDVTECQTAREDLTADLANYKQLQAISARLIPADDIETLYEELITAAISLTGADRGTMQSLEEDELRLLASRGLPQQAIDAWERVTRESGTSCSVALNRGERVIISDYATDERASREAAESHLDAGIHAAQSTPLITRSGQMVGMISTHWDEPHEVGERELRAMDILARQAADLIERTRSEEALRKSEKRLQEINQTLEERVEERTAELQEKTRRLRQLAAELTSAEQRERKRLAGLLHDNLQQLLYGAEMTLRVARDKANGEVGTAIDEASEWISEAVEAARNLTRQLRPPALYEAGLAAALKGLASEMAERHDLNVTLDCGETGVDEAESRLNDDVKAMLFDCARELLFNVVKHAGADEARVALRSETGSDAEEETEHGRNRTDTTEDRFRLIVEDDGCGFNVETALRDTDEDEGFGLFSIRERLAALGGSMTAESDPGDGTRIEVVVPLTAADSDDGTPSPAADGTAPVHIVIADDHAVVRQGIANLLEQDERTVVVGEATDGQEVIDIVRREHPDVVLMDVNMPELNGIEATRTIHRRWSDSLIIGLSVQADTATEEAMRDAGATAFVPKSGDVENMIETILNVTERES